MVLIEVHHGSLCAWTVLHSRVHTGWKLCCLHMPATTDGLHGVMLGNLKLQYGQIKDLACFAHIGKGQFSMTCLALVCYAVDSNLVGLSGLAQSSSRVTFLSACWVLTRNP